MKINHSKNSWYKPKKYPHIGVPNHRITIEYIKNSDKIARHSFVPFIRKNISIRRYRKTYDKNGKVLRGGCRKGADGSPNGSRKIREIHYANNMDSNIYSYYSYILNEGYESLLKKKGLISVVTAYRKVYDRSTNSSKNNIHFADEVFRFIKNKAASECTAVITFDIENFFPSLSHELLKRKWCEVIDKKYLPKDHYNVYRSITRYSYIDNEEIFNLFKDRILVEDGQGGVKRKPIKKMIHLYNKNAIAYCEMKDIYEIREKGLIKSNKLDDKGGIRTKGICQGSAISATLANIYMLGFDEFIHRRVSDMGGIYRRYSDDMIVVCPIKHRDEVLSMFMENIGSIRLKINPQKTQIFRFLQEDTRVVCYKEFNGQINDNSINRNLDYLGFSFDGQCVRLKNSSLAKYYRKMKLGVRRCKFYANTINNDTRYEIFKRRLYKRYSYIGANRRHFKYKRSKNAVSQWDRDDNFTSWGNYITYARNSHQIMGEYSKISKQLKRHWFNLNQEIRSCQNRSRKTGT